MTGFSHVRHWVFDLDNTLYPASCNLFDQIGTRMTDFVARILDLPHDEALALQNRYHDEDGTTLNGLMKHHGMKPQAFLDYVHDIDLTGVEEAVLLRAEILSLPGLKYIFTNGSRGHASRICGKLGLDMDLFAGVCGIEDTGYLPKPSPDAFVRMQDAHGIDPRKAAFFDDLPRNLAPAADLGYTTVLVHSDVDWSHQPEAIRPGGADAGAAHIHHTTDALPDFLAQVRNAHFQTGEHNDHG